ncbi:MAG: hypothetical protein N4A40_15410 [Tissierellales bacterium]|jgi:hypothetical protein|nr:hypothetical protein [Tissierellales bacterium]
MISNEINHPKWGKCIKIKNSETTIIVTIECGLRIIWFGDEMNNLFCDDISPELEKFETEAGEFCLKGGHRFWHSPESYPRTYQPDNQRISYEFGDKYIKLFQDLDVQNRLKKTIKIEELSNRKFKISHTLYNDHLWPIEVSIWPISMMRPRGRVIIPLNDDDTGYAPNNKLLLWKYSRPNDKRLHWGENHVEIQSIPDDNNAFKLGVMSNRNWVGYRFEDYSFVKRFEFENKTYPDSGCNVECFTRREILELETLSPLENLASKSSFEYSEVWEWFKKTFDRIDRWIDYVDEI